MEIHKAKLSEIQTIDFWQKNHLKIVHTLISAFN